MSKPEKPKLQMHIDGALYTAGEDGNWQGEDGDIAGGIPPATNMSGLFDAAHRVYHQNCPLVELFRPEEDEQ